MGSGGAGPRAASAARPGPAGQGRAGQRRGGAAAEAWPGWAGPSGAQRRGSGLEAALGRGAGPCLGGRAGSRRPAARSPLTLRRPRLGPELRARLPTAPSRAPSSARPAPGPGSPESWGASGGWEPAVPLLLAWPARGSSSRPSHFASSTGAVVNSCVGYPPREARHRSLGGPWWHLHPALGWRGLSRAVCPRFLLAAGM